MLTPRLLLALTFTLATAGCGGDDDADLPAECEAISEACHDVDPGSGPIHDCHELAHSEWSREECVAMTASCLDLCSPQ